MGVNWVRRGCRRLTACSTTASSTRLSLRQQTQTLSELASPLPPMLGADKQYPDPPNAHATAISTQTRMIGRAGLLLPPALSSQAALPASQSEYCGAERKQRERDRARARSTERSRAGERKSQRAGNFFALPVTVSYQFFDSCTFIDTLSVTLSNE